MLCYLWPFSNYLYYFSWHLMPFNPSKTRPESLPPSKKMPWRRCSGCLEIPKLFMLPSNHDLIFHLQSPSCSKSHAPTTLQFLFSNSVPRLMPYTQVRCAFFHLYLSNPFQGKGQRYSRLCLSGVDTSSGLYVSWGDGSKWLVTTDRPPATD